MTEYELDAVLGSLDALPNESADLEAEIDEAAEEPALRRMRRFERSRSR